MKIAIQKKSISGNRIQLQLSYTLQGKRKQQVVPGAIYAADACRAEIRQAEVIAQAAADVLQGKFDGKGVASVARRYSQSDEMSATKKVQLQRVAELWEKSEASSSPLEALGADDVQAFIQYLGKYSNNTQRSYLAQFVWLLGQEAKRGEISEAHRRALTAAVEKPAAEKDNRPYIEPADVEKLFNTPLPSSCSELGADAFRLSYYTGLRYSDIRQLTADNITPDYIRVAMHKTGSKISVPITDKARAIIEKHPGLFGALPVQTTKINRELAAWALAAQVQAIHPDGSRSPVTFHAARHSCATGLLNRNVPIEQVSALLGHKSISTTQVYAKIINTTLSAAVALL